MVGEGFLVEVSGIILENVHVAFSNLSTSLASNVLYWPEHRIYIYMLIRGQGHEL